MMKDVFGGIVFCSGLLMTLLAFPRQIKKNNQEKRCGIDPALILLPGIVYGSRIAYGILSASWWQIPPDLAGFVCTIVLSYQWLKYRKNNHW
ncbi:MAG: hypothetical protein HYV32_01975 [Candidatus Kerfeldbacteria bacterium]|nr:hypothetical protein [Candidatus Kerfeldbacteria bacterium]